MTKEECLQECRGGGVPIALTYHPPPPLELSQKEIQDGREALLNPGYFLVLDFRHRLELAKMNAMCIG